MFVSTLKTLHLCIYLSTCSLLIFFSCCNTNIIENEQPFSFHCIFSVNTHTIASAFTLRQWRSWPKQAFCWSKEQIPSLPLRSSLHNIQKAASRAERGIWPYTCHKHSTDIPSTQAVSSLTMKLGSNRKMLERVCHCQGRPVQIGRHKIMTEMAGLVAERAPRLLHSQA